jgi:hypothetical protein
VTTCQYCGRYFCTEHTYFMEGLDAVCTRESCRKKHDDLVAHVAYKARVAERNQVGLCGIEDCGPHPRLQCSLCQGYFCEQHLSERMYPFREGRVVTERPASVCKRCWDRRKIWRS